MRECAWRAARAHTARVAVAEFDQAGKAQLRFALEDSNLFSFTVLAGDLPFQREFYLELQVFVYPAPEKNALDCEKPPRAGTPRGVGVTERLSFRGVEFGGEQRFEDQYDVPQFAFEEGGNLRRVCVLTFIWLINHALPLGYEANVERFVLRGLKFEGLRVAEEQIEVAEDVDVEASSRSLILPALNIVRAVTFTWRVRISPSSSTSSPPSLTITVRAAIICK